MSELAKIEAMEAQEAEDNAGLQDDLREVAVLDDASAEMILRQLKAAEDQYDRMAAWYDTQKQKLKDIRDRTRIWAEACLRPYMDMVPTTGKKILSYDMPGGTLKLAQQDPEYEVDDAALVPWLEENGYEGMVEVKKKARWGEFKKVLKDEKISMTDAGDGIMQLVTEDGEIVPGITAAVREAKFSIKCK